MAEDAEIFRPYLAVTTSRRTTPLTNTFIKSLARVMNLAIIRRGSSNLDEIAYSVHEWGLDGFIVVYTTKGNPSALTFYRRSPSGHYELYGRMFLLGVKINRKYRGAFDFIGLRLDGKTDGAKEAYKFLRDFLAPWKADEKPKRFALFSVRDLEVYRDSWLEKRNEKMKPAEIRVTDQSGEREILLVKVHHVWRYSQK